MDNELSTAVKARLLAALAQIDAQLDEAEQSMHLSSLHSPLSRRIADVTPLQQQLIGEGARHPRDAMRKIPQRHALTPPAPNASAANDCRAVLNRTLAAIAELGPDRISRDDTLSDEAESELRRIVVQLLDRWTACNAPCPPRTRAPKPAAATWASCGASSTAMA